MKSLFFYSIAFLIAASTVWGEGILIPMEESSQTNHLKAYGVTYWALQAPRKYKCEWLLNYRGGSFLIYETQNTRSRAAMKGVTAIPVSDAEIASIHAAIEKENMEVVPLEKAPKVAVYTPPTADPWDDAVTLALEYADIPYAKIWDGEALRGELPRYDWLHLHHEDFTGQYGKFYASYRNAPWYQAQVREFQASARSAGFNKVTQHKAAVAKTIREYVEQGGFLFAMCAATDSLDIALAAEGVDIVEAPIDGDGVTPGYQEKLDFSKTLAFQNFKLIANPMIYEFSDIDTSPSAVTEGARYQGDVFQLFEFSAKFDPVPTMLTQDHVMKVKDFWGQTTAFRKALLKPNLIVLADFPGSGVAKYIHGVRGKGTFTFLGGHDPEDPRHLVGEKDTDLTQYPNSPGYRLILNNVLFPAAKKKPLKT
ncbi:MAG: asparagine synthetase B [Candidatus Omnitrophota bacterium]